jgi:hypothetical protein
MKKKYLVVGEFCAQVEIDPNDLKNNDFDEVVAQFSEKLRQKINNGEVLDNITSITEDLLI